MPRTEITSIQIKDQQIKRPDMNTTVTGSAVVTKTLITGSGLTQSSSGIDTGTGDVTLGLDFSYLNGVYAPFTHTHSEYIPKLPSNLYTWTSAFTADSLESKIMTASIGAPTGLTYHGIHIAHSGNVSYGSQLALRNNTFYYRSNENGTVQPWLQVADRDWVNSAITTSLGTYVTLNTVQTITAQKTWSDSQFDGGAMLRGKIWNSSGSGFRRFNDVAVYVNNGANVVGSIQIKVPITTSTMWTMRVFVSQYQSSSPSVYPPFELLICGYATNNTGRGVYCTNPNMVSAVRFGRNVANDTTVIIIDPGTQVDWDYTKVEVKEFYVSHSGMTSTNFTTFSNYTIDITTDETDFVLSGTITNAQFYRDSYYQQADTTYPLVTGSATGLTGNIANYTGDLNSMNNGFGYATSSNRPANTNSHVLSLRSNAGSYGSQIGMRSNNMYFRGLEASVWGNWNRVWSSFDFTSTDIANWNAGVANAWVQGGNAFGTTGKLGVTDANALQLVTGATGITRATLTSAGYFLLGSNSTIGTNPNFWPINANSNAYNGSGKGLMMYNYYTSDTGSNYSTWMTGSDLTYASGTHQQLVLTRTFISPASGTGGYIGLTIANGINQTSATSGITRDIYIGSTLTGAISHRALEIGNSSGWGLYQTGSSVLNYLAGNTGIGIGATNNTNLYIGGTLTVGGGAGTNAFGIYNLPQIQPDVTGGAYYYRTVVSAAASASAYNITATYHYTASQGTLGTNSSIGTQAGFLADSTITGATTNLGFYGILPAGANNWNVFMSGTAKNYLNGSTGIGVSTAQRKLHVYDIAGTWDNAGLRLEGSSSSNYNVGTSAGYITGIEFNNAAASHVGTAAAIVVGRGQNTLGTGELHFRTASSIGVLVDRLNIDKDGVINIPNLASAGNRLIQAGSTGTLSTTGLDPATIMTTSSTNFIQNQIAALQSAGFWVSRGIYSNHGTATGYLGSGANTSDTSVDIIARAANGYASPFHLYRSGETSGLFIGSVSAGNANISVGYRRHGTSSGQAYRAVETDGAGMTIGSGAIGFHFTSGQTLGALFTPPTVFSVSPTGSITSSALVGSGNTLLQSDTSGVISNTTLDPATIITTTSVSGTANRIAKFVSANAVGNSTLVDDGSTLVRVSNGSANQLGVVDGYGRFFANTSTNVGHGIGINLYYNGTQWVHHNSAGFTGTGTAIDIQPNGTSTFTVKRATGGTTPATTTDLMVLSSTGVLTVSGLVGSGNRLLQANSTGAISATALDPANILTNTSLSGGNDITITSNTIHNYKASTQNSAHYHGGTPPGGMFSNDTSSPTGALRILLPPISATNPKMVNFTVSIYNYTGGQAAYTWRIGGYSRDNANAWIATTAVSLQQTSTNPLQVRFGKETGTNQSVVIIGDVTTVWQYPKVVIENLNMGYSSGTLGFFTQNWTISLETTISDTIHVTHAANSTLPASDWNSVVNKPTTVAGYGITDITGTLNYIPRFSGTTSLGNSIVMQQAAGAGIAVNPTSLGGTISIGRSGASFGTVGMNVAYTATNNTYNYNGNSYANLIDFTNGSIDFKTAPIGTGGAAITFTSRMSILNAGGVSITDTLVTGGYIWANNVGSDKKFRWSRTGGNTFSIEHNTNEFYFYNETSSATLMRISNAGAVTIGQTLNGTGSRLVMADSSGTLSATVTDNSTNWNAAYNDRIVSAAFTGTSTKTLTLTQQDGGTVTASFLPTAADIAAYLGYYPTQSAGSATYGGVRNHVIVADTRNDNYIPSDRDKGIYFDFKANATDGLSDGATYHGVVTFRPYGSTTDFSGGVAHQLGFTNNGNLYSRISTSASAWQSTWKRYWNDSHFTQTDINNWNSVYGGSSTYYIQNQLVSAQSGNAWVSGFLVAGNLSVYNPLSTSYTMTANSNRFILYNTSSSAQLLNIQDPSVGTGVTIPNLGAGGGGYVIADSSGNLTTTTSGTSTNIYNSDGQLTGNRTLDGQGNQLTFGDLNSLYFAASTGSNPSITLSSPSIGINGTEVILPNILGQVPGDDYEVLVRDVATSGMRLVSQKLDSGTYTPTASNIGIHVSVTPNEATWTRVGDIVTVYGTCSVTRTGAGTATNWDMDIPVPLVAPSTFSNLYDITGSLVSNSSDVIGVVEARIGTDDTAVIGNDFSAVPMSATRRISYHYQYKVI